ncbi:hypothetical protein JW911_01880 [Candidatus Peregrinibacteria bacterium]|nr:hypothetical protein [Candidatus Peregrinibacteria bacterium]
MDKMLFVQREIKHVLEVLNFITPEERTKLMAIIDNLNYDDLVKILKTLYKVETEYFEFIYQDTLKAEEFIKSLNLNPAK